MIEYMNPHEWGKDEFKEVALCTLYACAFAIILFLVMWVFY